MGVLRAIMTNTFGSSKGVFTVLRAITQPTELVVQVLHGASKALGIFLLWLGFDQGRTKLDPVGV
jgi:hypothetical protein